MQTDATPSNNVTSVCTGLKVWSVSNFAQQLPTTCNRVWQSDATCSIQHHIASVCAGLQTRMWYQVIQPAQPVESFPKKNLYHLNLGNCAKSFILSLHKWISTNLKVNFKSEQDQAFNFMSTKRQSVLICNLSCKHFVILIFRLNSMANWIATYFKDAKIALVLSVLKYWEFHAANGIVLSVYTNQSNLVHLP